MHESDPKITFEKYFEELKSKIENAEASIENECHLTEEEKSIVKSNNVEGINALKCKFQIFQAMINSKGKTSVREEMKQANDLSEAYLFTCIYHANKIKQKEGDHYNNPDVDRMLSNGDYYNGYTDVYNSIYNRNAEKYIPSFSALKASYLANIFDSKKTSKYYVANEFCKRKFGLTLSDMTKEFDDINEIIDSYIKKVEIENFSNDELLKFGLEIIEAEVDSCSEKIREYRNKIKKIKEDGDEFDDRIEIYESVIENNSKRSKAILIPFLNPTPEFLINLRKKLIEECVNRCEDSINTYIGKNYDERNKQVVENDFVEQEPIKEKTLEFDIDYESDLSELYDPNIIIGNLLPEKNSVNNIVINPEIEKQRAFVTGYQAIIDEYHSNYGDYDYVSVKHGKCEQKKFKVTEEQLNALREELKASIKDCDLEEIIVKQEYKLTKEQIEKIKNTCKNAVNAYCKAEERKEFETAKKKLNKLRERLYEATRIHELGEDRNKKIKAQYKLNVEQLMSLKAVCKKAIKNYDKSEEKRLINQKNIIRAKIKEALNDFDYMLKVKAEYKMSQEELSRLKSICKTAVKNYDKTESKSKVKELKNLKKIKSECKKALNDYKISEEKRKLKITQEKLDVLRREIGDAIKDIDLVEDVQQGTKMSKKELNKIKSACRKALKEYNTSEEKKEREIKEQLDDLRDEIKNAINNFYSEEAKQKESDIDNPAERQLEKFKLACVEAIDEYYNDDNLEVIGDEDLEIIGSDDDLEIIGDDEIEIIGDDEDLEVINDGKTDIIGDDEIEVIGQESLNDDLEVIDEEDNPKVKSI